MMGENSTGMKLILTVKMLRGDEADKELTERGANEEWLTQRVKLTLMLTVGMLTVEIRLLKDNFRCLTKFKAVGLRADR